MIKRKREIILKRFGDEIHRDETELRVSVKSKD